LGYGNKAFNFPNKRVIVIKNIEIDYELMEYYLAATFWLRRMKKMKPYKGRLNT